MFPVVIPPLTQPFLVIVIRQIRHLNPPALALHLSEYAIFMSAELPVQRPQLGGAFYAARRGLLDVDVRGPVFFVFADAEGYGRVGDGFAQEPGDALLWGWGDLVLVAGRERC